MATDEHRSTLIEDNFFLICVDPRLSAAQNVFLDSFITLGICLVMIGIGLAQESAPRKLELRGDRFPGPHL
jgi:hypothetical protein